MRLFPKTKKGKILVILATLTVIFIIVLTVQKNKKPSYEIALTKRGNITSEVSVTGRVQAQKKADLGFEKSGKVAQILVKVGQSVLPGQPLIVLEHDDLLAQTDQAQAQVESAQAQLSQYRAALENQQARFDELVRGTRSEEIKLANTKTINAQKALADSQRTLAAAKEKSSTDLQNLYVNVKNLLNDAYIKTDKRFLEFFSDLREVSPANMAGQKTLASNALATFKTELDALPSDPEGLDRAMAKAVTHLTVYRDFLQFLNEALDTAMPAISQATYSTYKTNLNTGRTNAQTALSGLDTQQRAITAQKTLNQNTLAGAEASVTSFRNALSSAEDELLLKQAGSTSGELLAARASVRSAEANVALGQAQVKAAQANIAYYAAQAAKMTLTAPYEGIITKQETEIGEMVGLNATIVSLMGQEAPNLETYIPEADIAQIKLNDPARVTLDAYREEVIFKARVEAIDPSATMQDGVATYKTTLAFEETGNNLLLARPGLTANIDITTETHENVLLVPTRAVSSANGKKIIKILRLGISQEVLAQTGLRDTNGNIEILQGVKEGDEVAVDIK